MVQTISHRSSSVSSLVISGALLLVLGICGSSTLRHASAFHPQPTQTSGYAQRQPRNPSSQLCVDDNTKHGGVSSSSSPFSARCRTSYVSGSRLIVSSTSDDNKEDDATSTTTTTTTSKDESGTATGAEGHHTPLGKAYGIYTTYLQRLWKETSTTQRQRIARDRATRAVRRVQHLMRGEEYGPKFLSASKLTTTETKSKGGDGKPGTDASGDGEDDPVHAYKLERARSRMLEACDDVLNAMSDDGDTKIVPAAAASAEEKVDPGESQYLHMLDEEDGAAHPNIVGEELTNKLDPGESDYLHVLDEETKTTLSKSKRNAASKQVAKVDTSKAALKKKADGGKPRRSILFGAAMGALVAGWVFSGNYVFTGLFTLMTVLGQLEYYRMVMNTGVYPARRISVVGACSMFVTALFAPDLHQLCLPFFALLSMGWFLTMRKQTTSIPEISTTFTGMFLLGYIPSFWVRIRAIGSDVPPTRLAKLAEPFLSFIGQKADALPSFLPKFVHLPMTTGAVFIFWTWLSIAFSDVGAYFVGRSYGKTKLGDVAPAAGAASPNKTVEGVMGGCAISALLATLGAWVQRWPYWYITGPMHGIYLGALGLLGDLTASMIKRDADIKDFGDLIPEHGGIMDRVDSYIFSAPYSFVMCQYLIPLMTKWKLAGLDGASAGLVGLLSVPLVWFFSLRKVLQIREAQHAKRRMEEDSL